jgi:hypothetical protein
MYPWLHYTTALLVQGFRLGRMKTHIRPEGWYPSESLQASSNMNPHYCRNPKTYEIKGMVSQNTTVIYEGFFYLG